MYLIEGVLSFYLLLNRKTLLNGLHHFILLNLTIALALALLIFVIGIETATESNVSVKKCTLLHMLILTHTHVGWLYICGILITLFLYCCFHLDVV